MTDQSISNGATPSRIQNFIFARELAEVYLLLDNVSTSSSKTLLGAKVGDGRTIDAAWLEEVCEIGWPPKGSDVEQAKQAATLIGARDVLNGLAAPATGGTIAFTLLVAGEDKLAHRRDGPDLPWWRRMLLRLAGYRETNEANAPAELLAEQGWGVDPPSRFSLATMAFPSLARRAGTFRWLIRVLITVLFLWLLGTCVLSWDVTAGNGLLTQVNALEAKASDVANQITTIENGGRSSDEASTSSATSTVPSVARPRTKANGASTKAAQPGDHMARYSPLCRRNPYSATAAKLCQQQSDVNAALCAARANLRQWLQHWSGLEARLSAPCPAGAVDCSGTDAAREQWAATLLGVLGGAVLPIFYGLLGAGAAVVRSLSARMRESLLAPRLIYLSLVQLALGAVIGACIGLFVAPSGSSGAIAAAGGAPGGQSLLGPVPLSPSALCFIAGFGVEQVFVALEALLTRVFNAPDPTKRPPRR
jgi:hypothetical protein